MKPSNKKIQIFSLAIFFAAVIFFLFFLIHIQRPNESGSRGKKSENHEQLILGFSQIGSESAWRTRNTQSIFEAAEQNGIQILFDDAQQKQENQLKAIRSFIVYQVDVIAFVPIVEYGWDNVLREAKEAGIPVIVVDRQIRADESLYAGFLGEDGLEEGRSAAQFLLDKYQEETKPVLIFEMSGTKNSSVVRERASGFREKITGFPKFQIIHSVDGDFLRSRGKEIGEKLIQASIDSDTFKNDGLYYNGRKIDVVYSHNDSMTLGLLDSLENYEIDPSEITIISVDAEQKSIDALVEGKIDCVVECNPNLGPMLMELVKQVAGGNEIPRFTYNTGKVFTQDDDFSLYTPRGY